MNSFLPLPTIDPPLARTRQRLPEWLRVNLPSGSPLAVFNATQNTVAANELHTVCEEARCPNVHDCWARGTATFMIAGKTCTRGCRFCSVETLRAPEPPDEAEPEHLADAVERMHLEHVVITVVNRDDLPDGGASHYKRCVEAVHRRLPRITIELFRAIWPAASPRCVICWTEHRWPSSRTTSSASRGSMPPSATRARRSPRAYRCSATQSVSAPTYSPRAASWSASAKQMPKSPTPCVQLRDADVDLLTLGQYLAPGKPGERFLPVERYVTPEQFNAWADEAREIGFRAVASGPLVRSSYRAGQLLEQAKKSMIDD